MKTMSVPIFGSIEHIKNQFRPPHTFPLFALKDFKQAKSFLVAYINNGATFNAYRREVEKFLQWSWLVAKKSIRGLRRTDIEKYIEFCQRPPISWIGTKKAPRFLEKKGKRLPNPKWRPFVATVSKAAFCQGEKASPKRYTVSQKTLREVFTVLASFYNFLVQEKYTEINPVQHIKQKSHYFKKIHGKHKIRRLSGRQWEYVMASARVMASEAPKKHNKTLFILSAFYSMYLRISELAATFKFVPKMCDFYRGLNGSWWFNVVGKGNKQRQIAVSDAMLNSLREYRKSFGLIPLPPPTDTSPLVPKCRGKGPIASTNHLRKIVQECFNRAAQWLRRDKLHDEADGLLTATVHWLRHTGISDDVKHRPREHVRDDAGHSSSVITDKYIDIELQERHASAKEKPIWREKKNSPSLDDEN